MKNKNFIIYFFGSIVIALLSFIVVPFYTKYLSPAEYGIIAMFQVVLGFSKPLISFVLESNIYRAMVKYSQKLTSQLIATSLVIMVINVFLLYIMLLIFSDLINLYLKVENDILYIIPLTAFSYAIVYMFNNILIIKEKPYHYIIIDIFTKVLNYGVALSLLINFKFGYYAIIFAELSSMSLIAFFTILILHKKSFLNFNLKKVLYRQSYSFGLPLIASAIGAFGVQMIDRFFIANMLDTNAVGIYSLAYQFGIAINMIYASTNKVWSPWVLKSLKDKVNNKNIIKKSYLLIILYIAIYICYVFFINLIFPYLVDQKFFAALQIIPYIAFGYLVFSFYTLVISYIIYVGKTKLMFYITLTSFLLNSIFNYYLIPIYGNIGAAIATIISYVFIYFATFYLAQKLHPMPWNIFKLRS